MNRSAKRKEAARPTRSKNASSSPPLPRWKRWLFRIVLACVPGPLFLICLEGALRLGGYGYPISFLIKEPDGLIHENDKFLWRFYSPETKLQPYPFRVEEKKPPGTVRIFVLGESAALGTPEPAYGFWRMLEAQLRHDFPDRKFEMINAATRGINSHIILPIVKECAQLEPDLFIIYMGNNEVVGLHAPGPGMHSSNLRLLRLGDWVKGTRIAQLALSRVKSKAQDEQDMDFFRAHRVAADDPRRQAIYRNFEANLGDICDVISKSGARMILSTIPVNLKDCAPLGSLHRKGFPEAEHSRCQGDLTKALRARGPQALTSLQALVARDDHYAEWHYALAEHLGTNSAARLKEYEAARDWDAMQFRADSPINAAIRKTAEQRRIPLLDSEKIFTQSAGIPGGDLFYEHVHLRFAGDYLMAQNFYPAVLSELGLKQGANTKPAIASQDRMAGWLAYTKLNEAQLESSISQLIGGPPFEDQYQFAARLADFRQAFTNKFVHMNAADLAKAEEIYSSALKDSTNDWQLHFNAGKLLSTLRNYPAAINELQIASHLMPHYQPIRISLANTQAKAGRPADAISTLEAGLRIDPKSKLIRNALEQGGP